MIQAKAVCILLALSSLHAASTDDEESTSPTVGSIKTDDVKGLIELTNDFNLVCFRAILEAKMMFTYNVRKLDNTLSTRSVSVHLPENQKVIDGDCGSSEIEIKMRWNGIYDLYFKFEIKDEQWMATSIQFLVDTAGFSDAIQQAIVAGMSAENTTYFMSPVRNSFRCDYPIEIPLELPNTQVISEMMVKIVKIQVQSFGVPQTTLFSDPTYCTPTLAQELKENSAAVIVAAVLASVIVLIVIVYFIYKNRTSLRCCGKYEEMSGRQIYNNVKEVSANALGQVKNASSQALDRVRTAYGSIIKPTDPAAKTDPPVYSSSLDDKTTIDEMPIIDDIERNEEGNTEGTIEGNELEENEHQPETLVEVAAE